MFSLLLEQEPALVLKVLAQSVTVRVREDAEVRLQRLLDALFRHQSSLVRGDALAELPHYPTSCFRTENAMMQPEYIAKEVDTLAVFSYCHLTRVEEPMKKTDIVSP